MATQISWQKTVTTPGTAVVGPTTGPGIFEIKNLPTNTGYIYMGNDGADDVSSSTGFAMDNNTTVIITVGNMAEVYFDASVGGEGVSILLLEAFRTN